MNDLRLAIRHAARRPLLSLAAILSLALGIGANTAIFTVLHGSVLQPLPYRQPNRVVAAWETTRGNPHRSLAPANFMDWRREATAFDGLAAFVNVPGTLIGQGEAQRLRAVSASANFFEVLGASAAVGRVTTSADDRPGSTPTAVITDGLARRLFGTPPAALNTTLVVDDVVYDVVGVLPAAFEMPMAPDAEIWLSGEGGLPRHPAFPGGLGIVRDSHFVRAIGRLANGHSRDEAQAQLTAVMTSLGERYPNTNAGLGVNLVPLQEEAVGDVRPLILLLQATVAVLLLIACANVAHLLLGQAAARQAELATRLALGADRGRIIRQLLVETLAIAVPGGAAGVLLAFAGIRALVLAAPADLPRLGEVAIDGTVLAFACGTTLVTSLIFGLGPAFHAARSTGQALASPARGVAGSRGVRRWHHLIAVGELALAQVLLAGAALLVVSFAHATRVDLGFAATDRVAAEMTLTSSYVQTVDADGRIDPGAKVRFAERVIDQVSRAPGVHAVAAGFTAPLGDPPNRGLRIEGDPEPPPNQQPDAGFQIITPDYFKATGMTMAAGRSLLDTDRADSPAVTVVNQAFVARYFAGRNPIGRVISFGGGHRHEIVGVVADARFGSVERPADPAFYLPLGQNDERWAQMAFIAWADPAAGAAALVRAAVHDADPQQPIARIRSFDSILSDALAARRFNTWLLGLFAATALVLAAIGAYGVLAFSVTSRTREIGVRTALGAGPADVIRMVLGQGLAIAGAASVLGLVVAAALSRYMASLLFGVPPRDPLTFAAVAALLALVAMAAVVAPARRALRVSPTEALREG